MQIYSSVAEVRQLQLSSLQKQKRGSLKAQVLALQYLLQMEELLSQQETYARELVELTVAAEAQGVLLEQEGLEARMQEALVPLSLQQIRHNKKVILLELRELTGLPQLEAQQIGFISEAQAFREDFVALAQQDSVQLESLALNPAQESLAILQNLHDAAEFSRKVASGNMYGKPDIALQISFGLTGDMEKLFKGETDPKSDLVANLSLGLKTTLWDGGKKLNQLRRTQSQLRDVELDLEQARSSIRLELSRQINAMTMASLRIDYQRLKIQTAEADLQRAQRVANSGYGSRRDVLQAHMAKITEELQLLEEEINLAAAACTVEVMTRLE